jgi:hypothetical protein
MKPILIFLTVALALGGCGGAQQENAANVANAVDMTAIPEDVDAVALDNGGANAPAAVADTASTDAWLGRWKGPEGLFLDIRKGGTAGTYGLTLKATLDGQADYVGTAEDATIRFVRAGRTETIHAGTGKETGHKWLAEMGDCLIIVAGKEGYCR